MADNGTPFGCNMKVSDSEPCPSTRSKVVDVEAAGLVVDPAGDIIFSGACFSGIVFLAIR